MRVLTVKECRDARANGASFDETLHLHPAVFYLSRLRDEDASGFALEAGVLVLAKPEEGAA